MFHSFDTSEPIVHRLVPQWQAGVPLVGRAQVDADAALRWGVERVDTLLSTFFSGSFPSMEVAWGIEDDPAPNACVWGHASPSVVLLTSGAIREIAATRARLAKPAATIASKYAFPAAMASENDADERAQALAQAGENLGVFALAALFAHEVGHVHDRQFEDIPVARTGRLGQAHEIAADTWAIRACTELAVSWARSLADRLQVPLEFLLRSALYYVVVGHGLVDDVDWSVPWSPHDPATHPPGALRLAASAVAVSEWLADRRVLSEQAASEMAVEVFAAAAQTLYWLRTSKELPHMVFQQLFLDLLAEGDVIDRMRATYERFRAALPLSPDSQSAPADA